MKYLWLTCLFIVCCSLGFGQTEAQKFKAELLNSKAGHKSLVNKEFKNLLITKDFSYLFLHTDNSVIYGFVGDHYQRIKIKLIRVTKDSLSPDVYHVQGKSMVKQNIGEFDGTITISNIRRLQNISYGVDNAYKNKGIKGEYFIVADYKFSENKGQPHSGTFTGICESDFYLDKNNKVRYDDLEFEADGYTNNQFIGQWASYDGKLIQHCNWGDFRIPNSGDLDIGAGEFSPNDKYLKYGWQSRRDELIGSNKKSGNVIENAKWWK